MISANKISLEGVDYATAVQVSVFLMARVEENMTYLKYISDLRLLLIQTIA